MSLLLLFKGGGGAPAVTQAFAVPKPLRPNQPPPRLPRRRYDPPYVAIPWSQILSDTFTDTDKALNLHTPDTGGPWVNVTSSGWEVDGATDVCYIPSNNFGRFMAMVDSHALSQRFLVGTIGLAQTTDRQHGPAIRADAGFTNCLQVYLDDTDLRLVKWIAGVKTSLATWAHGLTVPYTLTNLELYIIGDDVTVAVNGTTRITYTISGAEKTALDNLTYIGFSTDQRCHFSTATGYDNVGIFILTSSLVATPPAPTAKPIRFRAPAIRLPARRTPIPFPSTFQYNAFVPPAVRTRPLIRPAFTGRRTHVDFSIAAPVVVPPLVVSAKSIRFRPPALRLPARRTPIPYPTTFQYNAQVVAAKPFRFRAPQIRPSARRITFYLTAVQAAAPVLIVSAKPIRFRAPAIRPSARRTAFYLTPTQAAPQPFVQSAKTIRWPRAAPPSRGRRSNIIDTAAAPATPVVWVQPAQPIARRHMPKGRRAPARGFQNFDATTFGWPGGGVELDVELYGDAELDIRAARVRLTVSSRSFGPGEDVALLIPHLVDGKASIFEINYDVVGSTVGTSTHWGTSEISDTIDFIAGDVLIVHVTGDNPGGVPLALVAGDGWIELSNTTYPGDIIRHAVWAKFADGPGVDDLTLTHASQDMRVFLVAVRDSTLTDINDLIVGVTTGNTQNPDPPSQSVSENDLVLVSFGTDHAEPFLFGPFPGWEPSGYTQVASIPSSLQVSSVTTAVAWKTATATGVEDPGVFTMEQVDQWVATTVVFPSGTRVEVVGTEIVDDIRTPTCRLTPEAATVALEVSLV